MNACFARLFNSKDLDGLLQLYEEGAAHCNGRTGKTESGLGRIREALGELLRVPGHMESENRFCIRAGEIALLGADWQIRGADGTMLAQGRSAEVARRQADGTWKTVIDHAVGASS